MNADSRYHERWNDECEFLGKLSEKCKELLDLESNKYLEKYDVTNEDYAKLRGLEITGEESEMDLSWKVIADYYERRGDCSCRLPISTADDFGEWLDELKDECFKKYPVIK